MKRFRFRFETVERVRKNKEQEALRYLAEAQAKYQQELARKRELSGQLESALVRRETFGSVGTPSLSFQLETEFIAGLKQRIVQADQAIVRATRGVEKALRHYLATKRQLKAIETLRELHFQEFKKQKAKQEQRQLDDLYTMRARLLSPLSPEKSDWESQNVKPGEGTA